MTTLPERRPAVRRSTIVVGKLVRALARLRGGGSALPGLVIERRDPGFVPSVLAQLPRGVVVVSGTNGKTTTTKMVTELLQSQGLKVFTNRTGSNFVRGVAAALVAEVDFKGRLDADIAVLELDEAHAVHFVKLVRPRHSLLLNVMRDQLDRFGEIDTTARMLQAIAEATTDGVVLNREDPRVAALADHVAGRDVAWFGFDPSLAHIFPSDNDLHSGPSPAAEPTRAADVELAGVEGDRGSFVIEGRLVEVDLALRGVHNVFNAAAALALVRQVAGDRLDGPALLTALSQVTPAFGRGEQVEVDGQPVELVLVKNPAGFRLSLASFPSEGHATMIAINDQYADGRDMSWLWDVSFEALRETGVAQVTGTRAWDMALRLKYDDVPVAAVEPDLADALRAFLREHADAPKRIFTTYTAMLALRKELARITDVEEVA
ncbi:MAG: MurT ligase domain-containing protein [Aeromicrobium sp.]|uniref:MurT ligase domain-containing protein n=1 Tax=Aeromicrobium sp. TaxID=1871063 RepID=UPI0039E48314